MPHVELPQAEFKVVVLGDTNTGKTSLVLRFVEGYYRAEARSATVGAFFLTKRLTVDSITCKMLLWDTAGAAQFQKLAKTYYDTAAAAVLVYDVSQPGSSLTKLQYWLDELQKNTAGRRIVLAIVACKCDLLLTSSSLAGESSEMRIAQQQHQQQARKLAESVDALYMETSSKDNVNVNELFHCVAQRVLQCQTEAARGDALPIPVTVGTSSNNNNNSSSVLRASSQFHPQQQASSASSSSLVTRKQQQSQNNSNRSTDPMAAAEQRPESPHDHHNDNNTSAAASENNIVESPSPEKPHSPASVTGKSQTSNNAAASSQIMCEGAASMLTCGSDGGDKGCRIM